MAWIIIIGGIVVIILLIIGMVVTTSREQTLVDERLNQYLGDQATSVEREAQRTAITDWVSKRVERTSIGDRISQNLARADMKLKVGEYFALIVIAVILIGGLAWLIGGRNIISFLIGAVVGVLAPGFYV